MSKKKYQLDEAKNIFFDESREMLEEMESTLLDLENAAIDQGEAIQAIFRAVHTIKGSAGMFGFDKISGFAHIFENILDKVRNNELVYTKELIVLSFECHDFILKLLDIYQKNNNAELDKDIVNESEKILMQLNENLDDNEKELASLGEMNSDENEISESANISAVESESWHISLRFKEDIFKQGLDPASFITFLGKMGKITSISTIKDKIPVIDEYDPQECYIGFEINFFGYVTKNQIEEVFEFMSDDCEIRILPPNSDIQEYLRLIEALPEENMYLGEILVEVGSLTKHELEKALDIQKDVLVKEDAGKIGEIVVNQKMVQPELVEAALKRQTEIKKHEKKKTQSIRIDISKLDNLINQVGELVISAANINQQAGRIADLELIESVNILTSLISDIRESSMNIRMVQIGDTFKRFERIVRDLTRNSGKKVDFVIKGGETELDKTLVEQVKDPIMHLVRNAIDHGIATPEERIASGKHEIGKLTLNAFHESGNVVIEIRDDGSGLDREKICAKIIEKDLLDEETINTLSDNDVFQYIFQPGFSTAEKITDVSGRGVGMDVVKKNIDMLRGTVLINSEKGIGTSIMIYLPLTLAIIDGFLVRVSNNIYVLPQNMIIECIDIDKNDINKQTGNYVNIRGEIVPFVKLREFFKDDSEEPETQNIIVVENAGKKYGLIIDRPLGEFQTVVKPLGYLFKEIDWISGATILGNGDISLILDLPRLLRSKTGKKISSSNH